jgi:fructose-1,6-bisphosphatase
MDMVRSKGIILNKKTPEHIKAKHKIVLDEMLVNGMNAKKAMKKAGYTGSTLKNPKQVIETKSFLEMLNAVIPDSSIIEKHNRLLNARVLLSMHFPEDAEDKDIQDIIEEAGGKLIRVVVSEVTYPGKKGQDDITVTKKVAYYAAENTMTQDKALDKLYKLRGDYAAEKKVIKHEGFSLGALFNNQYDDDDTTDS